TDATGTATARLIADQPSGPHALLVEAPALAAGPGASTSVTFTVGPNAPPVIDLNGPYDVVIDEPFALDTLGSSDPDGAVLPPVKWDLDDDGQFDDATGNATLSGETVRTVICGGSCDPATVETIA